MSRGRRVLGAAAGVLAAAIAVVVALRPDAPAGDAPARRDADARPPAARRDAGAPQVATAGPLVVSASAPAPVPSAPLVSVAEAMAQVRVHGDPRVPPIDPPAAEAPRAEPWEIADPAAYRQREQRLARAVDDRFVQAAAQRLPELRAALAELQSRGATAADIAIAEDKIRHLEAVQDALVRGVPLAASR